MVPSSPTEIFFTVNVPVIVLHPRPLPVKSMPAPEPLNGYRVAS
jgi:hypothetical protein